MYEISEETAPVLGADLGVEKMSLLFSAYLAGGAEYALGGGNGRDAAAVARAGRRRRDRGVSCQSRYVGQDPRG